MTNKRDSDAVSACRALFSEVCSFYKDSTGKSFEVLKGIALENLAGRTTEYLRIIPDAHPEEKERWLCDYLLHSAASVLWYMGEITGATGEDDDFDPLTLGLFADKIEDLIDRYDIERDGRDTDQGQTLSDYEAARVTEAAEALMIVAHAPEDAVCAYFNARSLSVRKYELPKSLYSHFASTAKFINNGPDASGEAPSTRI